MSKPPLLDMKKILKWWPLGIWNPRKQNHKSQTFSPKILWDLERFKAVSWFRKLFCCSAADLKYRARQKLGRERGYQWGWYYLWISNICWDWRIASVAVAVLPGSLILLISEERFHCFITCYSWNSRKLLESHYQIKLRCQYERKLFHTQVESNLFFLAQILKIENQHRRAQ